MANGKTAATVTATVRIPVALKKDADKMIKSGHYKNMSDLLISGLRLEIRESNKDAVTQSREAKRDIWEHYMKLAKGDLELATKLELADIKKGEAEEPWFYVL
ncbi:MAG: hypothetical protein J4432_01780 [DPANN group archaeon]|nr:hypothetical protein [DPANN group archaeon]